MNDMHEFPSLIPIVKLTRDAIAAMNFTAPGPCGIAGHSSANEARILIDLYYGMQDYRKAVNNQIGAMDRGADVGNSHAAADFMESQVTAMESNAKAWLEAFASTHVMWPWFSAVHGIGPVLAAGLIAHLGSRPVPPTVGHWWRFAGLDPSQKWLGADEIKKLWDQHPGDVETRARILSRIIGRDPNTVIRDATTDFESGETKPLTKASAIKSLSRIPFNRPLKTLAWKVTDQFVKLGGRQDALYAVFYRQRKADEILRNESGGRAELAAKTLSEKPTHAQRATYEQGKLPDGRVDLMARRATVKLFLSHLHELWYEKEHGTKPPAPFSLSIKGHAHYIPPYYREVFESMGQ